MFEKYLVAAAMSGIGVSAYAFDYSSEVQKSVSPKTVPPCISTRRGRWRWRTSMAAPSA